jgi:hypothetical protein
MVQREGEAKVSEGLAHSRDAGAAEAEDRQVLEHAGQGGRVVQRVVRPSCIETEAPRKIRELGAAVDYQPRERQRVEEDQVVYARKSGRAATKHGHVELGTVVRDEPVVVDGNLVTSRKPDDIPQFNEHMIATFGRTLAGAR